MEERPGPWPMRAVIWVGRTGPFGMLNYDNDDNIWWFGGLPRTQTPTQKQKPEKRQLGLSGLPLGNKTGYPHVTNSFLPLSLSFSRNSQIRDGARIAVSLSFSTYGF